MVERVVEHHPVVAEIFRPFLERSSACRHAGSRQARRGVSRSKAQKPLLPVRGHAGREALRACGLLAGVAGSILRAAAVGCSAAGDRVLAACGGDAADVIDEHCDLGLAEVCVEEREIDVVLRLEMGANQRVEPVE